MFLRKSGPAREPLPLAMIALRMGERVLQIGLADVRLMTTLASKPGISGRSALVVHDDRVLLRAQSAAAEEGILLESHVVSGAFPFDEGAFDVAIVHAAAEALAAPALAETLRVLRAGGRVVVVEPGAPEGIAAWWRSKPPVSAGSGDATAALERAGFRAVRLLADREGYRFTEGLKR